MATNEELAAMVQAGDRKKLVELWEQVRRLVWQQASRWTTASRGGVEVDDLLQAGFIAVMRAADGFDGVAGTRFTTYLVPLIKSEFSLATGRQTRRTQMDPIQSAASLDAPLTDDEGELTLADLLPDLSAEAAIEEVAEQDQAQRLHDALEAAIATLEPEQQAAVRRRYYDQAPPLPPGLERLQDSANHAAALRMLRHPSRSRELLSYW